MQGVGLTAVAVDLRPAGDAGLDPVARAVFADRFLEGNAGGLGRRGVGARADHRHAAGEHVEQLRQLVDAGLADEATDPGDAVVVAGGLAFGVGVGPFRVHRAELEDPDQPVVVAVAFLPEQHRPLGVEPDRQGHQGHQGHQRGEEDQRDARQDQVLAALDQRRPAAQRQLGRVEHGDPGNVDDAVVGMPEGSHVRHQQDVHRQLPQAVDDGPDAPLGEPGQGDQHLVDLFLADQFLQVLGVAQQRQRVVVLRDPLGAVVDEADDAGADVVVAYQVFGQVHAALGEAEDHRALQVHAAFHPGPVQAQHQQALHAEQQQAAGEPEDHQLAAEVGKQAQALVHEQQQAERRGPGEEHDAEAQAVAEDIVGVDVQCLEHDHRERAEEQQQPEHVAAQLHGNQAGVVQQEQRRGDGGERVYQLGRDQEVLDESSPCQRQAIYRLRMHVVCSADHGQSIEWIGKSKAVKRQFSDYFSFATRFSHFPVE